MIEKIGKYKILERVGRGGMGTVFKAHDPILNRLVALKVISGEVEVSDELKARFFREARACAKLNHPNIILVYDLGEDEDRLFIVMEFLEGEELKRIIAERRPIPLETKLGLMTQICDGLHYAHQHGVIHRDIKPGNIFVLRNGQARILDFGIARIAANDPGLTRTGLIMGTLRYMSPEQARGRVDQRSDIFSVGAVFYELLAYRPAFDRENPMEILEQLRAEEPPSLTELDPSIPPELAHVIERALRKNPDDRFQDLGQMREALEQVLRQIAENAEGVRAEVGIQLDEVRTLRATLANRLGAGFEDSTLPVVHDDTPLSALHMLQEDLVARQARLRALAERAEAVEPALARGLELLASGRPEEAIDALESVLREIPDHVRAQAALRNAREALAPPSGPQPATEPAPTEATTVPPEPVAATVEVAPRPAEAPEVPAAATTVRWEAEVRAAEPAAAPEVPAAATTVRWEAEVRAAEPAAAAPEPAVAPTEPAAVESQPVAAPTEPTAAAPQPEPEPTEPATRRDEPTRVVELGEKPAPTSPVSPAVPESVRRGGLEAREIGIAAAVVLTLGVGGAVWMLRSPATSPTATASKARPPAQAQLPQAVPPPPPAPPVAPAPPAPPPAPPAPPVGPPVATEAELLRAATIAARQEASSAEAQRLAPAAWGSAEQKAREAETAFDTKEDEQAQALFRDAQEGYRRAMAEARGAADLRRAQAEAAGARRAAESAQASRLAASPWARGGTAQRDAEDAAKRQDLEKAGTLFRDATKAFREAEVEATRTAMAAATTERERAGALRREREAADQAVAAAQAARREAEQAGASRLAAKALAIAQEKEKEGRVAVERQDYAAARDRFREAQQDYQRARQEAVEVERREMTREGQGKQEAAAQEARETATQAARQREAEQLRAGTAQARALAEQADAKRLAPKPWTDASGKEADAQGALGRRDLAVAILRFREARQEFQRAATEAQQAAEAAKRQAAAPPPRPPEPTQPGPPVSTTTPPADSQTGGGLLGAVKRAFGGKLQGVSGPVAWEVVGVKTDTLPAEVRWSYTLVLRETTGTAIQFDRVVHSVARGTDQRAQVTEERFRRRLEANAELRLARTDGLTHSSAPGADAVREGVTVWRRFYGKDEKGKDVVIDIQFRM